MHAVNAQLKSQVALAAERRLSPGSQQASIAGDTAWLRSHRALYALRRPMVILRALADRLHALATLSRSNPGAFPLLRGSAEGSNLFTMAIS